MFLKIRLKDGSSETINLDYVSEIIPIQNGTQFIVERAYSQHKRIETQEDYESVCDAIMKTGTAGMLIRDGDGGGSHDDIPTLFFGSEPNNTEDTMPGKDEPSQSSRRGGRKTLNKNHTAPDPDPDIDAKLDAELMKEE